MIIIIYLNEKLISILSDSDTTNGLAKCGLNNTSTVDTNNEQKTENMICLVGKQSK